MPREEIESYYQRDWQNVVADRPSKLMQRPCVAIISHGEKLAAGSPTKIRYLEYNGKISSQLAQNLGKAALEKNQPPYVTVLIITVAGDVLKLPHPALHRDDIEIATIKPLVEAVYNYDPILNTFQSPSLIQDAGFLKIAFYNEGTQSEINGLKDVSDTDDLLVRKLTLSDIAGSLKIARRMAMTESFKFIVISCYAQPGELIARHQFSVARLSDKLVQDISQFLYYSRDAATPSPSSGGSPAAGAPALL